MRRKLATLAIVGTLALSAVTLSPAPQALAFTGHHCSISTCKFFTSSYSTAVYYYNRSTCDQWRGLSRRYLNGFKTAHALKRQFHRRLHPPC